MMNVPWTLLMQICNPNGHRPEKKEEWKPVVIHPALPSIYQPTEPRLDSLVGNLPNPEYRYYMGDPERHNHKCACRWCGQMISVYGIQTHRNSSNCSHMVDVVAEALKQDRLCVICQTHTAGLRWGVPLCPKVSCEREFRFGPSWSVLWRDLVSYVKTLEKGTKIGHVKV